MRKALPQMLELAGLLMAHEALARPAGSAALVAADVCDKLRPQLSTLMGATGFRALLTRAHTIAASEVPLLRQWRIDAAGALVRADGADDEVDAPREMQAGGVLVAQLLNLLAAFIGEGLTIQLLAELWPQTLASFPHSRTGDRA